MGKIVVPVDFSECSESNCKFSLKLASQINAELVVLHCFNDTKTLAAINYMDKAAMPFQVGSPLQSTDEKETEKALSDFLDGLKKTRDRLGYPEVEVSQQIVYGTPADEIINFCEKEQPDMLILSSSSSGDRIKRALGSLSFHLLKSVKVPALVIPRDIHIDLEKELRLAFVSRFEENEVRSMNKLIRLISGFKPWLDILHVASAEDGEKYATHLERLKTMVSNFYKKKHKVSFELIEDNDWIEGIKQFAEQNHTDIISFTTKRRGFFAKFFNPGMTKSLLFDFNVPLLVFHG